MPDKENKLSGLWSEMKSYLDIQIEYAKLTAAEKLSIMITSAAFALLAGVFALLAFFFVSVAAVHWLGEVMSVALAYSIMAGFYVLLLALLIIFRKKLLVDPLTRFISKLILR